MQPPTQVEDTAPFPVDINIPSCLTVTPSYHTLTLTGLIRMTLSFCHRRECHRRECHIKDCHIKDCHIKCHSIQ